MSNPSPTTSDQPPTKVSAGWWDRHVWQIQPVRDLLLLGCIVGLVWLGYRLSVVTIPLLLALFLAYLVEPLVKRVTVRHYVTRTGAAIMLLLLGFFVVIVPTTLGIGFAVVQGLQLAKNTTANIDTLIKSVATPEDSSLRGKLPSASWRKIRDYIVEQEAIRHDGHPGDLAPETGLLLPIMPPSAGFTAEQSTPVNSSLRKASADDVSLQTGTPVPRPAQFSDAVPSDRENVSGVQSASTTGTPSDGAGTLKGSAAPGKPEAEKAKVGEKAQWGRNPSELYGVLTWLSNKLQENAEALGKRALEAGGGVIGGVLIFVGSIGQMLFGAFLTAFFFYFFCTGWGRVLATKKSLIPTKHRARTLELLAKMDMVIAAFIRGRLLVCAIMIVLYTFMYWFIGVPAPFLTGPLTGILTLIPYASSAAVPVAIIMMWLDPSGSGFRATWWWIVCAPIGALAIAQALDDWVVTPTIQGKATNMEMPTILFASIAGGSLAGVYGLLVAIPVAACIRILLQDLVLPRLHDWAQGRADDPLPLRKE